MAEYISKEEILAELDDAIMSGVALTDCDSRVFEIIRIFKRMVNDFSAADVKTEIHAYWIRGKEFGFRTHNPMWYCSNCGGGIRYNTTLRMYEKHKKPVEEVNCFCRKCGAKMDLEPIYEREETNNGIISKM